MNTRQPCGSLPGVCKYPGTCLDATRGSTLYPPGRQLPHLNRAVLSCSTCPFALPSVLSTFVAANELRSALLGDHTRNSGFLYLRGTPPSAGAHTHNHHPNICL